MSGQKVSNRKAKYVSRAKVGASSAQEKRSSAGNRRDFEVQEDGYFVWPKAKKRST